MSTSSLRRTGILLGLTALLASSSALAGGFLVYEPFGDSVARGGASVGNPNKPNAIWFNAGGLALQPDFGLTVGTLYTTSRNDFEAKDTGEKVDAVAGNYLLPHLFVAAKPTDWMSVGIGAYSVYGLGTEWPENWFGREYGIYSAMTTVSINPTIAFKLMDNLGLGLGFDIIRGSVETRSGIPEPIGGEALFGGEGWGYGLNVGLAWQPIPNVFHVGAAYRSRARMEFTGRIDYDPPAEFTRDLVDQSGTGDLVVPDILALGVSYWPHPKLELALDGVMVMWSTYDVTKIKLDDGTPMDVVHDYHNSFVARFGMEWQTPLEGFITRFGLIYDQSPAPSEHLEPTLPDADQIDITAGIGYRWSWLSLDLGYQLDYFLPSEATGGVAGPEGTYRTIAHMLALSATCQFDWEKK